MKKKKPKLTICLYTPYPPYWEWEVHDSVGVVASSRRTYRSCSSAMDAARRFIKSLSEGSYEFEVEGR